MAYSRRTLIKPAYRRKVAKTWRRRRTIRKRTYPRRKTITRKKILNITSRKKRDHMLSVFKQDVLTPATTLGGVDFGPGAGTTRVFGWIATARDNTTTETGGNFGSVYDESTRTSDDIFLRGIKEKVQFVTDNGQPFQWRRIVFTFVGQEFIRDQASASVGSMWAELNTTGWARAVTRLEPVAAGAAYAWDQMQSVIFRGRRDVDWVGYITAPLDVSRIRPLYDRTRTIRSNNEQGTMRTYHHWHGVNKRLLYNDDEVGGGMESAVLSANNRQSCGDVYVIDIFELSPASGDSHYLFHPQSTMYWHER